MDRLVTQTCQEDVYKRQGVVCLLPEVDVFTETLEENAMVQYKDRQAMVVLKGVEDNFEELTAIDSILYGAGDFLLHDSIVNYGVMGGELVATLGTGLQFVDPLQVYLPKRNTKVNMANPGASFNRDYLYSPGVVFVVNQQEYDGKYILTSLDFLRQLLDYTCLLYTSLSSLVKIVSIWSCNSSIPYR